MHKLGMGTDVSFAWINCEVRISEVLYDVLFCWLNNVYCFKAVWKITVDDDNDDDDDDAHDGCQGYAYLTSQMRNP